MSDQIEIRTAAEITKAEQPQLVKKTRWERGMATIEYAVGILAAATVALVLLRIFNDNAFFKTLMDWVVGLIQKIKLPA